MSTGASSTPLDSPIKESSRKRKKSKPEKSVGGIRRGGGKIEIGFLVEPRQEVHPASDRGHEGESSRKVRDDISALKNVENPSGGNTPQRGRGRPKGSVNKYPSSRAALMATEKPDGENRPKRPRGRPKGSRNKNPSRSALQALQQMESGAEKRGRGRPRKLLQTNGEETPKRARGRPKGSVNKSPSAKKLAKNIGSIGSGGMRKRGRPKKFGLHHSSITPKRPRGRPKITERSVAKTSGEMRGRCPMGDNIHSAVRLNHPKKEDSLKRGRGRPRKEAEPILKKPKHSDIIIKSSHQEQVYADRLPLFLFDQLDVTPRIGLQFRKPFKEYKDEEPKDEFQDEDSEEDEEDEEEEDDDDEVDLD